MATGLPALPPSLVARILSYNVADFKDVAQLRLLNLVTLLPSLLTAGSTKVYLGRQGDGDYAMRLVDADVDEEGGETLEYDKIWDECEKKTKVEGVSIVDGFVSKEFQRDLDNEINKNITPLRADPSDVEAATVLVPEGTDDNDGNERTHDFWGRRYEDSVFQWLPTYFRISKDGQCPIDGCVNNLVPREQYPDLYRKLGTLFEQALSYIESVYSYVQAVRPCLRADDDDFDYQSIDLRPLSLRGQRLQVITKIVDYELEPQQSHSGVWHVEGMSHEEIVLTCLYVLDRDEASVEVN